MFWVDPGFEVGLGSGFQRLIDFAGRFWTCNSSSCWLHLGSRLCSIYAIENPIESRSDAVFRALGDFLSLPVVKFPF